MSTFNIRINDELLQHIFPTGWPTGGGQAVLERIGGVPAGTRLLWCALDRDSIVFNCERRGTRRPSRLPNWNPSMPIEWRGQELRYLRPSPPPKEPAQCPPA